MSDLYHVSKDTVHDTDDAVNTVHDTVPESYCTCTRCDAISDADTAQ